MGVSYYFIATNDRPPHADGGRVLFDWKTLPLFFGTVMYGLEAILMALPIQGSMKKPEEAPKVIFYGTALYGAIGGSFGAICYWNGFGDCGGGGTITDCFPNNGLADSVRIALAAALTVGYPCILYPVTEIVEELLLPKEIALSANISGYMTMPNSSTNEASNESDHAAENGKSRRKFYQIMIRLTEVALTCVVGAACTNFTAFASVVGTILIPIVGFVLPAVIHIALFWRISTISISEVALDATLIVLGLSVLVVGILTTVK